MKDKIRTALDRFVSRHSDRGASSFMPLAFFAGFAVAVAGPKAYDHFTSSPAVASEVLVSNVVSKADDLDALGTVVYDKKAISAELEKNKERQAALLGATAALNRMNMARDPNSHGYPEGAEGLALRETDFEKAKLDYQEALVDAELTDIEMADEDVNAGPHTAFKIDELGFSLDALEALGGDVETARKRGGISP
jgi:hypothetical protein|nr:hypothetical protein [Neorhizobium tomejilense]